MKKVVAMNTKRPLQSMVGSSGLEKSNATGEKIVAYRRRENMN